MSAGTGGGAALSSLEASGKGFAAGGPIGAIAAGTASLVSSLLQHSARLKGAKTENEAVANAVPAFDSDIQEINQAFNNGDVDKTTAISALNGLAQNLYTYLHSLVGAAGTAWTANSLCNKTCTVSCCLYYNDIMPSINAAIAAVNTSGGATSQVSEIYGDKYGLTTRPGYTLTWHQTPVNNIKSALESTIDELTGQSALPGIAAIPVTTSISPTMLFVGVALIGVAVVIAAIGSK